MLESKHVSQGVHLPDQGVSARVITAAPQSLPLSPDVFALRRGRDREARCRSGIVARGQENLEMPPTPPRRIRPSAVNEKGTRTLIRKN